jgi:hypothetical protein
LNINLLSSIILNYCYIKKGSKKIENKKQKQKEIFENFLSQEEKQMKNERIFLSKERNKIKREELLQKLSYERKLFLDSYKENEIFTEIIEPTFDCYIPIKQFSIPLEFYTNQIVSNIFDHEENENKEINVINEDENSNILEGKNKYDINIPIHLCEDNINYFDEDFLNDLEKEEEENNNEFLEMLKSDDNLLFY